jgi:3-phytase
MNKYLLPIILVFLLLSCKKSTNESNESSYLTDNTEAREDSIKLAMAYKMRGQIQKVVFPAIETDPVGNDPQEDAADDPAFWLNEDEPDSSFVFGTNKKSGIHVFNLHGRQVEFYPFGKINNIDIRQKIQVGDEMLDVLGGSNRSDNSISLYKIDSAGKLSNLLANNHRIDTSDIDEVYGFCLYKNKEHDLFALVNGKNGVIHQYKFIASSDGMRQLLLTNTWRLQSQPEGMVVDDELGILYVGEEDEGIWKIALNDPDSEITVLPSSQQKNNPAIVYDIEGLALHYGDDGSGFLLASIQGNFSYALFDRKSNDYFGSFRIDGKSNIDGVEETDGLEIYSHAIGQQFPNGLLIVQDGFNFQDSVMISQNYKFIDLNEVLEILPHNEYEK